MHMLHNVISISAQFNSRTGSKRFFLTPVLIMTYVGLPPEYGVLPYTNVPVVLLQTWFALFGLPWLGSPWLGSPLFSSHVTARRGCPQEYIYLARLRTSFLLVLEFLPVQYKTFLQGP